MYRHSMQSSWFYKENILPLNHQTVQTNLIKTHVNFFVLMCRNSLLSKVIVIVINLITSEFCKDIEVAFNSKVQKFLC